MRWKPYTVDICGAWNPDCFDRIDGGTWVSFTLFTTAEVEDGFDVVGGAESKEIGCRDVGKRAGAEKLIWWEKTGGRESA